MRSLRKDENAFAQIMTGLRNSETRKQGLKKEFS